MARLAESLGTVDVADRSGGRGLSRYLIAYRSHLVESDNKFTGKQVHISEIVTCLRCPQAISRDSENLGGTTQIGGALVERSFLHMCHGTIHEEIRLGDRIRRYAIDRETQRRDSFLNTSGMHKKSTQLTVDDSSRCLGNTVKSYCISANPLCFVSLA
ncbi:hypothetical protein N8K70_14800 [Microbacterium betulae]|uniref:Uncharacterized protein n=1 Tax=Microbacterium betulae TaxID=2981139 RepID=A0AA97FGN6_9MICO|nr:hypothetical protein [Microbacterium sp. AB]WOF22645.1 hypothetical protein N8K70_14800 [Microbacterium sp. AB]